MSLAVVDTVSVTGSSGVNEDAVALTPTSAVVVDGASGLTPLRFGPDESDAQWFARTAAAQAAALTARADLGLADVVRETLARCRADADRLRMPAGSYPSGSLVVARWSDDLVEVASLGDCTTVIGLRGGRTAELSEHPVAALDRDAVAALLAAAERDGVSPRTARPAIDDVLRRHRSLRNTDAGYWIADPTGAGADHVELWQAPAQEVESLVVMADGLAAYRDVLRAVSSGEELLRHALSRGLGGLAGALVTAYDRDPDWRAYPRLKGRDDATGVVVAVYSRSAAGATRCSPAAAHHGAQTPRSAPTIRSTCPLSCA